MKTSRCFLIGLACLTGCSSLDYRAYNGEQLHWPISPGAFVEVKDTVRIYHALPEKPYTVLGSAVMVDNDSGDLAKLVKKQHGDAGIISNERILTTGTRYVPGMSFTFGGGNFNAGWFNSSSTTISTPGRVESITQRVATGYVIKFKDPVRAKLDDLRSAIEWADANSYGATVNGTFITADQILAGEKQLLQNLNLWIAWCDQHPSGGSFPDIDGTLITVPAATIIPIRAELQKYREHVQSKFSSQSPMANAPPAKTGFTAPESDLANPPSAAAFLKGVDGSSDHVGTNDVITRLREAAEKGDADAQSSLATLYYSGLGIPQDYLEAVKWFRKAADQNNAMAQYNLGVCYAEGQGVPQDVGEARKWYRKAAAQGNTSAQFNLGCMYDFGVGVPTDHSAAVQWYRNAAEQGHADAQNNLGLCYANGQGVPQDYAEAVKWFRKAAQQGDLDAQCNLGRRYEEGQGVAQDSAEALKWFGKAAEQGDAAAQFKVGGMYAFGLGVSKDYVQAVKWYRKAAEQGHADAQYYLSGMYHQGQGVTQDDVEALKWLRKAAEQGFAKAQYLLGAMYNFGLGVPKDYVEAYKWYNLAAAQGDSDATKARDGLVSLMTREQIAEGQKLARDFQPTAALPTGGR